jgi:hypothetical protein
MNDNKLISSPIHAPIHELEGTETKIPLISVINKRIFVGLLGIREESFTLLMGYEPITFF